MAKKAATATPEQEKTGVDWKPVQASSLSEASRGLYEEYASDFADALDSANKLKDAVTKEWNEKYPNGIDGQICSFNAIGGHLNYVMVDKKAKEKKRRAFDPNEGDNVFRAAGVTPVAAAVKKVNP